MQRGVVVVRFSISKQYLERDRRGDSLGRAEIEEVHVGK